MGDVVPRAAAIADPAACSNCGGETAPAFETTDRNRKTTGATFRYRRCTRCGLVCLENVPDRLADYYGAEYYGEPTAEEFAAAAREHEGYKVELVRRFAQAGRLLDIGPARGGFAYLARESGFDVTVAEPDRGCCAFIAKRLGIRAVNSGDVVGVLAREEAYDVITLWHVIEHLADPFAALAAAAGALRPGGVLVLAAPNPQALQLRVFGSRWTHIDAPRHLALIPLRVLEQRSGLRTLLRTTSDPGGIAWNAFGWRESLGNLTTVHVAGAALRRAGSALAVLAAPIERRGLCGAAYTVVFGA